MPGNNRAVAYQSYAANCAQIAQQISDPDAKLELLGIAQAWLRLAEQALKNEQEAEHRPEFRSGQQPPFASG